jgi:hypothetical protein
MGFWGKMPKWFRPKEWKKQKYGLENRRFLAGQGALFCYCGGRPSCGQPRDHRDPQRKRISLRTIVENSKIFDSSSDYLLDLTEIILQIFL